MKFHFLLRLLVFAFMALPVSQAYGLANSCANIFSVGYGLEIRVLENSEIVDLVNSRYRSYLSLRERIHFIGELSINLRNPYRIHETSDLLVDGKMPSLASARDIIVVRKSRAEGIAEIKEALSFPEERAWMFVPSLELWIYNSIGHAEATGVGMNGLLSQLVAKEFGGLELYHTHPDAAMVQLYESQGRNIHTDFEHFQQIAAVPSPADLKGLTRFVDKGNGEVRPHVIGYVVHRYGLTSYEIQVAYPARQNAGGKPVAYLPKFDQGPLKSYLLWLNSEPGKVIRTMLDVNERVSKNRDCESCAHRSDRSVPQVILELIEE